MLGQPVSAPPPNLPWANVVFADSKDRELVLEQVKGTTDFEDCVCLKAQGNFPRVLVHATVTPSVKLPICDSWWVRLNKPGEDMPWQQNTTSHKLGFAPGPQSVTDLELCIRARNVSRRVHTLFPSKEPAAVAAVTITMMPNI
jgi:hypothetical protein